MSNINKTLIEEFLNENIPEEYDISNESAPKEYINEKDVLKKFFIYQKGGIKDPDSKSELLQSIYNLLWDKNYLYFSKGYNCIANHIQGDCILSANTTLNYYYELFESNEIRNERKTKGNRYISGKYLSNEFFSGGNKVFESLDLQILNTFLSLYHTVGNYMPIPLCCNVYGKSDYDTMSGVFDYFDIKLKLIFKFYETKDDTYIYKIVFNNADKDWHVSLRLKIYKAWLESFGNWRNFINDNYLQPFVDGYEDISNNIKDFGNPIIFWNKYEDSADEHSFDNALPLISKYKEENLVSDDVRECTKYQCEEYFKKASQIIKERSKIMMEEIKNRLQFL